MLKYSITIRYDKKDEIFIASVPELRGCMAHGETPEDALKEIKTAMELWIEDAVATGANLPEPSAEVPLPRFG